jgi:hypothetical protein
VIPQIRPASDEVQIPRTLIREQWLINLAVLLRPWFSHRGYEIPLRVRLGVGALTSNPRTLGVCHAQRDRDGFQHITISPFIDDPVVVASVLVHELIHAALPTDEVHGRRFQAAARSLGLEGRSTATVAGPDLRLHLQELIRRIGPYPHKAPAVAPVVALRG